MEELGKAADALAAAVGPGAGSEMSQFLASAVEDLNAAAEKFDTESADSADSADPLASIIAAASAVSVGLARAAELLSADYSAATRNLSSTFGDQLKHRLRRIGKAAEDLRTATISAGQQLAESKIVPPSKAVAVAEMTVSGAAAVNALLAPSIAAAAAESENPRTVPEVARILLAGSAPVRLGSSLTKLEDSDSPTSRARALTLEQIGLTFGGVYVPSGSPPSESSDSEGSSSFKESFTLDLSGPGMRPAIQYRLDPLLDQRGSALRSSTPSFTEVKRHDTFVLAGEVAGASAAGAAYGPGLYRTLDGGGTWERLESENWDRFHAGPSPVVGIRASRVAAAWFEDAGANYSEWAEKAGGDTTAASTPTPGEVAVEAGSLRGANERNPAYPPGVYSEATLIRELVSKFMSESEADFLAAVRGPPNPMESYIGAAVWSAAEKAAAGGSSSSSGASAVGTAVLSTPAAIRERGLTAIVQRRSAAKAIRRRLIRASKNPEWVESWKNAASKSAQASRRAYRALLEVAFVSDTAVEKKGGSLPELSAKLAMKGRRF